MYVCTYACMYVCMYGCMYVRIFWWEKPLYDWLSLSPWSQLKAQMGLVVHLPVSDPQKGQIWYVGMQVCRYARMYVCMHACMYVCMYVSVYLCIYVSMYLCFYVSMYLCIYVSIYLSMYLYIYVTIIYLSIYLSMYACSSSNILFQPLLLPCSTRLANEPYRASAANRFRLVKKLRRKLNHSVCERTLYGMPSVAACCSIRPSTGASKAIE